MKLQNKRVIKPVCLFFKCDKCFEEAGFTTSVYTSWVNWRKMHVHSICIGVVYTSRFVTILTKHCVIQQFAIRPLSKIGHVSRFAAVQYKRNLFKFLWMCQAAQSLYCTYLKIHQAFANGLQSFFLFVGISSINQYRETKFWNLLP